MRLAHSAFGLAAVFALPVLTQAGEPPERTVKDLAYGEVLFEFYQNDHLAALTRLLAGLDRNELPAHARDADLLLGALYLSYGQHRIAGDVFTQVLEQSVDPELHDRAWYFLARIWHQRGYLAEAEAALARISGALPEAFEPERIMLEAQVLMDRQRFAEALAVLEAWEDPDDDWIGYAKYNIGVALVRLGDVGAGARILDQVGRLEAATDEQAALRDKANVALGYAWLQAARPVEAKPALQRVRLTGPYSNKALLGVGWADAELENYRAALVPWIELKDRDLLDSAVQESLLAVPYAFSQLSADAQAAEHYLAAIDAFTAEIARLDRAVESVRSGELLAEWLAVQESEASGWYFELQGIPATDESRYLVELMASHEFQEGVKNYRDLLAQSDNLSRWLTSLGAFDDILDTRQRAYEARLPLIESSLGGVDLDALERRRMTLASRLLAIEQTGNAAALGTPDQQRIWQDLKGMEPKLALLDGEPNAEALRDKHRFFAGILRWELERDFRARLWSQQRSLRELERELKLARQRHLAVATASADWPADFDALTGRIEALRPRIEMLLRATDAALVAQRAYLERVAVAALGLQRERLNTYIVQARFSLASIYDRAAANVGGSASGGSVSGGSASGGSAPGGSVSGGSGANANAGRVDPAEVSLAEGRR